MYINLQMVMAKVCEIGCAIAACEELYDYKSYTNSLVANSVPMDPKGPTYLVVCLYGPGYYEDQRYGLYRSRPYRRGRPCSKCPEDFPLCDVSDPDGYESEPEKYNQAVGTQRRPTSGLCC